MECLVAGLYDEFVEGDCKGSKGRLILTRAFKPEVFQFSPELRKRLEVEAIDGTVIHSHGLWTYSGVAARRVAHSRNTPLIVSPHGMLDPWALGRSAWKKRLVGWLSENNNLRSAACIHALCESEARSIRAYGLRNPICTIPNGIDLPETDGPLAATDHPRLSSIIGGRKILLYLGRIHSKKGLPNLLRGWADAQKRNPRMADQWVLTIAGWNQEGHEEELHQLANDLGLGVLDLYDRSGRERNHLNGARRAPSVLFLGPQFKDDKAAWYRCCDAFVLPSLSEGLPMVVLEAWSYGKPVLMTPECNLPEGFAANAALEISQAPDRIAERLGQLFEYSDADRLSIGDRGLRLVKDRFTWSKVAKEMRAIYQWVLGGGPRPDYVQLH